jgi:hypothetical protein
VPASVPISPIAEPLVPAMAEPMPDAAPVEKPSIVTPIRPAAVAAGDVSVQKLKSLWSNISNRARSEKPSIAAGLSRATVDSVAGGAIVLRVPDGFSGDILKRDLGTLERAIEGVLGLPLTVRILVGSGSNGSAADVEEDDGGSAAADAHDDVRDYAFKKLL